MNKKKNAVFSILFFWFYILLICPSVYAKDKVNLDLIGRWRNAGLIMCAEILRHNAHSYAYCGTTGGLLILDVTDPYSLKENAFLQYSLNICFDKSLVLVYTDSDFLENKFYPNQTNSY